MTDVLFAEVFRKGELFTLFSRIYKRFYRKKSIIKNSGAGEWRRRRIEMKKTAVQIATVALVCICTLGATACQFYPESDGGSWSDGNGTVNSALYEIATELGNGKSEGEWMDDVNGAGTEAYKLYREAKTDGYNGSFVDFLKETGYSASERSQAVGTAIQSVVSVYSTFEVSAGDHSSLWPGFGGWFGDPASQATSAGAGVIYELDKENGDAYIVTNYHVVYYSKSKGNETVKHVSDKIRVCLYGMDTSRAISATYVGGAMQYDIAVLKIENSDALRDSSALAASIADSDAVVAGETVYAIGNPEGEGVAVSSGVVSVEAEYIDVYAADDQTKLSLLEIRTDTAVNHGNSGGGLFNADGKLVGIVNARLEDENVDSFGYAIPSNLAIGVAQNVIDNSKINTSKGALRATLGITVQTANRKSVYSESTGKSYIQETVVVQSTVSNGLADGVLRAGDILYAVSVNGGAERVITRLHNVSVLLFNTRLGDTWKIVYSRDGTLREAEITFANQNNFTVFR